MQKKFIMSKNFGRRNRIISCNIIRSDPILVSDPNFQWRSELVADLISFFLSLSMEYLCLIQLSALRRGRAAGRFIADQAKIVFKKKLGLPLRGVAPHI